jgi:hypothetical protein
VLLVGLELKSKTGSLSPAQREMGGLFGAVGAVWRRVRSLDEVQTVLEMAGVPLHARVNSTGGIFSNRGE